MRHKFNIPEEDKFLKKIILAISLLILILVFGTYLMTGTGKSISTSLYSTVAMITHVNLDELNNSYLFLVLSLLGYVTQFYILYVILEYVLEGKLRNVFSEVKILNQIKHLKNHYIICGGGRVGKNVAIEMQKYKRSYVVIEQDQRTVEKLKSRGIVTITGDSLEEKDLIRAGIKDASFLVAGLGDDGDNILLTLTAKELNPDITISARAGDEKIIKKLKHAGAGFIILPEKLGGQHLAHSVIREESKRAKQAHTKV